MRPSSPRNCRPSSRPRPGGTQGGGGANPQNAGLSIWADEQTNALIVTAPPKVMRSIMAVVDKIDIRRATGTRRGDHRRGFGRQQPRPRDHLGRVRRRRARRRSPRPISRPTSPGARSRPWVARRKATRRTSVAPIGPGVTFGLGRIRENGTSFAAIGLGTRRRFRHQHYFHADHRDDGQRRGADRGRPGSAVHLRLVHEHRRHDRRCKPIPDHSTAKRSARCSRSRRRSTKAMRSC